MLESIQLGQVRVRVFYSLCLDTEYYQYIYRVTERLSFNKGPFKPLQRFRKDIIQDKISKRNLVTDTRTISRGHLQNVNTWKKKRAFNKIKSYYKLA